MRGRKDRDQRVRTKQGKRLGGRPRKHGGRWTRARRTTELPRPGAFSVLSVLAIGLFVVGGVVGFGFALDRQLRGGLLRQQSVAERRPDWVGLHQVPRYVPAAFLAVVDPGFAEAGPLRAGDRGTTITRDLVRQVHLLGGSVWGEARELVMAPLLEKRESKREILEMYLNRVYLGEASGYPVYGVYHAAQEYFDKEAHDLTLGEAATLAGLLLQPRITDPERSVGAVGVRRNEVLRGLLEEGAITPEQYRAAIAEPLGFQPGLRQMPMTRPPEWLAPPPVIRLPANLRPMPDSTEEN